MLLFALCCIALFSFLAHRYARTHVRSLFLHIEHILWGNLSRPELRKFLILAAMGVVTMTTTWGLKTLKDSFFIEFVGPNMLWHAKLVSVVALVPLIFLYNFLTTKFTLEKIFSIICTAYALLFLTIGSFCLLADPATKTIKFLEISSYWIGWLAYLGTESFSTLIATHYYTYIASTTTTESAKRGFGLIIVATQIGNYLGPTGVIHSIKTLGFAHLLHVFSCMILFIPLFMKIYTTLIPVSLRVSDDASRSTAPVKIHGIFEGIRLLANNPYLLGLAFITIFHEAIGTMLDLQFKILISNEFSGIAYAQYYGSYAQANALLGIFFGFFGTSFLLRKLGIKTCLVLYPLLIGSVVAYIWAAPELSIFFIGMVCIKTLGYTLNRPLQEIMFIPTTRPVKTQVKSIVDGLGKRGGKAVGASVLGALGYLQLELFTSSIYTALLTIAIWLGIAASTGKKYEELINNKQIIG